MKICQLLSIKKVRKMVNKEELSSLFNAEYFEEGMGEIVVDEPQCCSENDLCSVRFCGLEGCYLKIKPDWLKDTSKAYNAEWKGLRLFRRDCDSILLLCHKGVRYAIWLELKSGYNEVAKKGIFQIVGSYIRSKSYLNTFLSYNQEDYKELAVIITHGGINNKGVFEYKKDIILPNSNHNPEDIIVKEYRRKLKTGDGCVLLKAADFNLDKIPMTDFVKMSDLPLRCIIRKEKNVILNIEDLFAN